jgi:hypothetical protein
MRKLFLAALGWLALIYPAVATEYQIQSVTGWVSTPIPLRLPTVDNYRYFCVMPGPFTGTVRTEGQNKISNTFLGGTISIPHVRSTPIGTFQASSSASPIIAPLDYSSYGLWLDTNGADLRRHK